jgi:hypothetical protein
MRSLLVADIRDDLHCVIWPPDRARRTIGAYWCRYCIISHLDVWPRSIKDERGHIITITKRLLGVA